MADTDDHDYQSRRQFAELFQEAPMFMALLRGPEHRFEFVNPGYLRLIGHREVVGHPIAEVLGDAASQGYVGMLDEVYRSGAPISANGAKYAMQAAAGGPVLDRYVDFVLQPVRASNGEVAGVLVLGSDVTDRVQSEIRRDALARLTDALRELRSPGDISWCAARILGETLGASRAGFGLIGAAGDTLHIERDWCAEGVESMAGAIDLRQFGSFIDELRRGRPVLIRDVRADPQTAAAADALVALSAASFLNLPVLEDEQLVAMVFVNATQPRDWTPEDLAFIREVAERTHTASERLRSEIALAASEAMFRTIANAMPQMVWSTLPDGYHDYYNERWYEFTGMEPGSTDGAHWADVLHPEDRAPAWAAWRDSLASGQPYEIQYRLRDRAGVYRWVLGRAMAVRDDDGAIVRWMGTCTDIDDQKQAENALRLANQRKDDFLAMLAHELRNPLAPISTAAQVLRLRQGDPAYAQRAGEIIERQVRHMTELVDDLLDVSRVTRGLVQMEREPVELRAVVDAAVEQVRPLIEARHHELAVDLPPGPVHVNGDRTRLVQAISNLLNNAAKYTQQHGALRVTLADEAGRAAVSVHDNGSGIPPALLPHVFDLFTQGERTPERAQGGLGLGLTLVKSIAQLHGGAVAAASAGQGQGSTFTISLPTIAPPAEPAPPADGGQSAAPAPALRIVVVDDNRDAGASLAAALEAQGHTVDLFDDAEALLAAGDTLEADAYILDIGLPRIDGYELARRLRQRPASAGALLVALTGYGQAHDFTLSKGAGFDHHLVKPANLDQLERILHQHALRTAQSA
ncbi:MAG: ATP-binding protein [Pseudomonadota bacterium]